MMFRESVDDSGHRNVYGTQQCPRCGELVTRNAWGFRSHLRACLKRPVGKSAAAEAAVKGGG